MSNSEYYRSFVLQQLEVQEDVNKRINIATEEYFKATNKRHKDFQKRLDGISDDFLRKSNRRKWIAVGIIFLSLIVCFGVFFFITYYVNPRFAYQWGMVFVFFVLYFTLHVFLTSKERREDRKYRNKVEKESSIFSLVSTAYRQEHFTVIAVILQDGIRKVQKIVESKEPQKESSGIMN